MPSAAQPEKHTDSSRPHLRVLGGGSGTPAASRIGSYELHEEIGHGGMATVYRAWHTGLHRYEALKLPRSGADGVDTEYIQRLLNEACIAAGLHHPHIVGIHNISEAGDPQPYFSMDLIEGKSLAQILEQRGTLPLDEALPILQQTADAISHAHNNGVVHRDLKPENILLQDDADAWNVKVVDFGISRAAEDQQGTRLTRSGVLVGTPEYMSPEQSGSGQPVDGRTDIYSLGIVAYQMLTGAPPFEAGDGVSRMAVLVSQVNAAPRPPQEINPHISPEVSNVILKALAKDPDDRFASAEEFSAALKSAAFGESPAKPRIASPIRQRRGGWLAGGAVLIGLLAGLGVSSLMTHYSAAPPVTARPAVAAKAKSTYKAAQKSPAPLPLVKHQKTVNRAIAFSHETRRTAYLDKGKSKVVRPGRDGVREVVIETATRGDKQMLRHVLTQKVVKAPLPEVKLVGTRVAKKAPTHQTTSHSSSTYKTTSHKSTSHKAPARKSSGSSGLEKAKSVISRVETLRHAAKNFTGGN